MRALALAVIVITAPLAAAPDPFALVDKSAAHAQRAAVEKAEDNARASIAADIAAVRAAAAAGSTAAQMRDGFAAMLRLLKAVNEKIKENP